MANKTGIPRTVTPLLAVLCLVVTFSLTARVYELPSKQQRLIGTIVYHKVVDGDYFQQLAEDYNVGLLALMAANPGVDPLLPRTGSELVIPTQMLLPSGMRKGVVINLPELRLYYFSEKEKRVYVYPVGIGRMGYRTPLTISTIGEKRIKPDWYPPEDLRERYKIEREEILPEVVPWGPDNPLGDHAMRLASSEYLIHGTNQRFGVGMSVSSGCIRMYPDDIKELFEMVTVGTVVRVINEPVKTVFHDNRLQWIEVHSPLEDVSLPIAADKSSIQGDKSSPEQDDSSSLTPLLATMPVLSDKELADKVLSNKVLSNKVVADKLHGRAPDLEHILQHARGLPTPVSLPRHQ